MRKQTLLMAGIALLMMSACENPMTEARDPLAPAFGVDVDNSAVFIPPPGYPVSDDAYVTEVARGKSKIMRWPWGATADAALKDQTPGHVLVYTTFVFNHPEYCLEGEDRLPEPGPCRANGPMDPRDGGIPEVLMAVDTWAYAIVGDDGIARFHVDLSHDVPSWSSPANGSPGLTNPGGAVIITHMKDKGLLAPAGPLRDAQTKTLFGGCQGPPAFGPLPCQGVAIAQHLPDN